MKHVGGIYSHFKFINFSADRQLGRGGHLTRTRCQHGMMMVASNLRILRHERRVILSYFGRDPKEGDYNKYARLASWVVLDRFDCV